MLRLALKMRKYWYYLILVFLFSIAQVYFDLKLPFFLEEITSTVDKLSNNLNYNYNEILITISLKMLMLVILSGLLTIIINYFSSKLAASFSKDLRSELFDKVNSFSMSEIDKFQTSSLITRTTNDINQLQMGVILIFTQGIRGPIMAVGGILSVINFPLYLALSIGIAIFLLIVFIIILSSLVIPKFKIMQEKIDNLNLITRENLTGIKVIRAFSSEEYQEKKFNEKNKELMDVTSNIFNKFSLMMPVMNFLQNGLILTVVLVSAYLVHINSLKYTEVASLVQLSMHIFFAFFHLIIVIVSIPRASISAKRIKEILDVELNILDPNSPKKFDNIEGNIEFKNVSFKYSDANHYVLYNLNFKIKKGETVAIVGSTGSGKSTLINLIPRFFDPTEGSILIDGINIKEVKQEDLRKKISYISQKGVLFQGSIESNINLNQSDFDEDRLMNALKISQSNFVLNLEGSYNYNVSQRGTNLSGGQKQRISIARGIYNNPKIIIFDDTFSALDLKTDKLLRAELNKSLKDVTKVIVAQRIATIMNVDKIIVLDKGNIVDIGMHHELINRCDIYKEIALSQLDKEELL